MLAIEDAVANKVAALYSRGESRDYLDVDAIRSSARFTDDQLIELASNSDPGFNTQMFAERLRGASRLKEEAVDVYGVGRSELDEVKARIDQWAQNLTGGINECRSR